jgi:hypothetical protein
MRYNKRIKNGRLKLGWRSFFANISQALSANYAGVILPKGIQRFEPLLIRCHGLF